MHEAKLAHAQEIMFKTEFTLSEFLWSHAVGILPISKF